MIFPSIFKLYFIDDKTRAGISISAIFAITGCLVLITGDSPSFLCPVVGHPRSGTLGPRLYCYIAAC